jgi:hypothetical protein
MERNRIGGGGAEAEGRNKFYTRFEICEFDVWRLGIELN